MRRLILAAALAAVCLTSACATRRPATVFTAPDSLPDAAKFSLDLPLRVGRPFNRFLFQASADTLTGRLRNAGYPSVEVLRNFSIDKVARTVQVSLDVLPGRIANYGGVRVEGATKVDTTFIRQLLVLERGERFSQQDLTESQQRCRPYTNKPDAALKVATCMTQAPVTGAVAL